MPCKVSVIVPTYAPGDRITRLVDSLDAQTMPRDDFEVIFVDDGSPDDTIERLEQIQATRDNVRIRRIENSGWPSRPRNVGLEMAEGEYVLFMDHDDELYPRALEAGYAMAARTGADVLNGKETRTDQSKWALEVYAANVDNAIGRTDLHPLIPTNPHKLFRRALLMEHDIRFPEGRRVLWEDVFFCLDVARHAKVISVLAEVPFYHWVRGRTTASSSYHSDRQEYWRWVTEIVVQTNAKLAEPRLRDQWRLMMLHQYRSRILAPLASVLSGDPAEQAELQAVVTRLVDEHIPVELDQYLTPTQLGRATLLRQHRWDLVRELASVDAGLMGIGTSTTVRWTKAGLEIVTESRWATGSGRPLSIRRAADGRVERSLPDHVAAVLPEGARVMDPALESAAVGIGIRDRETALTWMIPGTSDRRLDEVDGRLEFSMTARVVLDPQHAIFGRPLDGRSWDLTSRNELLGAINQRNVRTSTTSRTAVRDGHVYIAYTNKSGMLSLDVDQRNRSLAGSAGFLPHNARWRSTASTGRVLVDSLRGRRQLQVEIPFKGVVGDGSSIEGAVLAGEHRLPARIDTGPDGAWLATSADLPTGTYPLSMDFHGRVIDTKLQLTVPRKGAPTIKPR